SFFGGKRHARQRRLSSGTRGASRGFALIFVVIERRWVMRVAKLGLAALAATALLAAQAAADVFHFSTGTQLNDIGVATRPGAGGKFEIEAGDDFILKLPTAITHATFTGLLTNPSFSGGIPPSTVNSVTVEMYRVFPALSDVGRTSGPPLFSTSQVPTRVN